MSHPLFAAALALLTAGACTPLAAQPLVGIDVIDRDNGQPLPQYPFRGDAWIAGTPGHRYSVRLDNRSSERVLVVLSVDGVNAVTGETADPAQAGYVLAPWQSTEITGWRKSLEDVAGFVFTDLPDSYAARTGRPDNVGVIGIAVFREARPVAYEEPAPLARDQAAAKAAAPAAEADAQRLGTGHGARERSPTSRTSFVRASAAPSQVTQVRYDDVAALTALGVLPPPRRWWHARPTPPQAFPAGFVPDPPSRW